MKKIKLPLLTAVLAVFSSTHFFGQDHKNILADYISHNKLRDFKKADLTDFSIDVVDESQSLNGTVIKTIQLYKGLPVYNSTATALVKDNKVIYYADSFLKDYQDAGVSTTSLTKELALAKVSDLLGKPEVKSFPILGFFETQNDDLAKVAKQRLIYVEVDGHLKLAYEFTLQEPKSPNYWDILIDANSGSVLKTQNLNLSCNFHDEAFSHDYSSMKPGQKNFNFVGPNYLQNQNNFSMLAPDNASYNVFALPLEAPSFGARSIQTNPYILAASPQGWHSNGTTHYTTTRGNNVFAYQDLYDVDVSGTGTIPDGGATRNFNFPLNLSAHPLTNDAAAITNLFYINNKVHDIFYQLGFNEAARNFQSNNFGLGGVGNDNVNAEAQDGGGTEITATVSNYNNANFSTPQDGGSGRMQMYLWVNDNRRLFYNAPSAAVPRTPVANPAAFGAQLTGVPVTGNVKLSPVLDACTPLPANSLAGFIGLAERAPCPFVDKVQNMQDAGAIGAIIYNAASSIDQPQMGGTSTSIYIPSLLIDNAEGEYIKSQLASNISVNVSMNLHVDKDGSFDNGVMIHEYGHGISNRLTGNGYSCLSTSSSTEQMGEGWSDFFALMLTNKPGDNATVARGMATYVIDEPVSGSGIRPAKYSTDMSVNGYTYANTNSMVFTNSSGTVTPDVHSIGFVWATILWDLHWKFVEQYGYSSDVMANSTNGSTKALQLVTNALKLQTCNPTFIDGRNAIIAADLASSGGANKCTIWRVFARRGVGVNASAGTKTSQTDQVPDFTVPAECFLATNETSTNEGISIYPNPAKNEFSVKFPSNTLGKVKVDIYDASGKLVAFQTIGAKENVNTQNLPNGVYVVKMKGLNIDYSTKLMIKK